MMSKPVIKANGEFYLSQFFKKIQCLSDVDCLLVLSLV